MTEKHDPLNPDSEQRLFESLSMSSEDREMLEFIRRQMSYIVRDEKRYTEQDANDQRGRS